MFELIHRRRHSIKDDILSGLTVALALVPEAIAFAFVAGVEPLVGLYAAFMVGLITATMGGRPGMISGATGALAVVMVALVADHGVEYLFAAVVLMGVLQITAGAFRLGKFIRMVPHPVMLGFVNGLAIVIFLAQLGQFGIPGDTGWLQDTSLQGSILDVAVDQWDAALHHAGFGWAHNAHYSVSTQAHHGGAVVSCCNHYRDARGPRS